MLRVLDGPAAHHWAVNVTGVLVQHDREGVTIEWVPVPGQERQELVEDPTAQWLAIFDTSASVLSVPEMVAQEFKQYLDSRNLVDCSNTSWLPVLMISLDGRVFQ